MTDQPAPQAPAPAVRPNSWWMPNMRDALALSSTAIFAAVLLAPLLKTGVALDSDLKGAVILQWGSVMSWYFGSSVGSASKDKTIAAMAKGDGA